MRTRSILFFPTWPRTNLAVMSENVNRAPAFTLFALGNLFLVRRRLMA